MAKPKNNNYRRTLRDVKRKIACQPSYLWQKVRLLRRQSSMVQVLKMIAWIVLTTRLGYKAIDKFIHWYYLPTYSSKTEFNFRSQRFPSVEERVKLYMSNWYLPSCDDNGKVIYDIKRNEFISEKNKSFPRFNYTISELESFSNGESERRVFLISNEVFVRLIFFLEKDSLDKCFENRTLSFRFYCKNAAQSILTEAKEDIEWNDHLPILAQFSDETMSYAYDIAGSLQYNPRIPHIKKIRHSLSQDEIDRLTQTAKLTDWMPNISDDKICISGIRKPPTGLDQLQPIIWLLNIDRHFKKTRMVRWYDQSFERKKDQAIFRGILNGLEYSQNATDDVNCQNLERCNVVYRYANSTLVNAKLTETLNKIPTFYRGVKMVDKDLTLKEMLTYKGIIVLEGNDVASSLKWAMVSKSVVLMRPPKFTSWAMEELLEPFVHYIPLNQDFTDIELKVQWMLDHPEESKRISHRANLWILDLFYHPEAMRDNRLINQEILRRYRNHFLISSK